MIRDPIAELYTHHPYPPPVEKPDRAPVRGHGALAGNDSQPQCRRGPERRDVESRCGEPSPTVTAGRITCQSGCRARLCIQERLPAGAAGILISRYHSSPDLILPIDATEKRMLDAVDGRRTIAATTGTARGDELLRRARHFFERLYWYDQIVFDSSRS